MTAGTDAVGGASISLAGPVTRNATTGGNGQYSFTNLNAGTYTVTLTLPTGFQLAGNETLEKSATVVAGQTTTVNWGLVAGGGGGNGVTEVKLQAASFDPAEVKITVGETVRFVGVVGVHNVTPNNPNQEGVWTAFDLSQGATRDVTLTVVDTFAYQCTLHPGMSGTIIVESE